MKKLVESSTCVFRSDRAKKIPLRERRGRVYVILNPNRKPVTVLRWDGCEVTNRLACDFVVCDCTASEIRLIELKGKDFNHAVEQLRATLEDLVARGVKAQSWHCRVVLSSSPAPNIYRENFFALRRRIASLSKGGGTVEKKTRLYEEII